MVYPALTARKATKLAERLLTAAEDARVDADIPEDEFITIEDGEDYDRLKIEAESLKLRNEWEAKVASIKDFTKDDLYLLEIVFSARIHRVLKGLHVDFLEDEGFWRYLALFPFRWYLFAREGGNLQPQNYGGVGLVPDGDESNGSELPFVNQVVYRAYVIGQAMEDLSDPADPYLRANSIPRGGPVIDFWHSHVLRVQIGRIGDVPLALVDSVSKVPDVEMKNVARQLAKSITRFKSNILLDVYEKKALDLLLATL